MIYLITDTHFGHENIKKYCNRPDNFENILEENLKKTLTNDDLLIHLGDVAFKRELINKFCKLPGKKILIKGNHDKCTDSFYMSAGFTLVAEEITLNIEGYRLLFTHRPKFGHEADINIHGHFHSLYTPDETRLYLPLSLEHMGYEPIALDDSFMAKLKPFIIMKKQPTTEEIITLFENAIGEASDRDISDEREPHKLSKERLNECYELFSMPPYSTAMRKCRLWDYARNYAKERSSRADFISAVRGFVFSKR